MRRERLGWLLPSLTDWLFIALLSWLFLAGTQWAVLLADGDTGWHIRTGETILATHEVPKQDLFSFSKSGKPWYAWEWLSDVAFAAAFRAWHLKGVVLLAGLAITMYLVMLFRHMLWRGANALIALAVVLLASGASSIHFLARPHVFTLLLMTISLWLVDRDRSAPRRTVWLLVPLTALWANLHAGFTGLLASLALVTLGSGLEALWLERSLGAVWRKIRRPAALAAACGAASLANPYGISLHRHVFEYLRASWIRDMVDEFQSVKFRSESALYFEILLFAALLLVGSLLRRRRITDALLVVFWAHAALVSARHVLVFAIVACPIIAGEATLWWNRWSECKPRRSVAGIVNQVAADFTAGARRLTPWIPVVAVALALMGTPIRWPRDFPELKFPAALIGRQQARLASGRVLTSDQWGGYLIYRFYPRQKVFVDGRSDFYGAELVKRYLKVAYTGAGWRAEMDRYGFEMVLAPKYWPLATVLRESAGWRVVDEDSVAVLLERSGTSG